MRTLWKLFQQASSPFIYVHVYSLALTSQYKPVSMWAIISTRFATSGFGLKKIAFLVHVYDLKCYRRVGDGKSRGMIQVLQFISERLGSIQSSSGPWGITPMAEGFSLLPKTPQSCTTSGHMFKVGRVSVHPFLLWIFRTITKHKTSKRSVI